MVEKHVIKNGKWKKQPIDWQRIGQSAGLSKKCASEFYKYLCAYAHTNYLSVMQISNANNAIIQKSLFSPAITHIMIAMSYMIKSYSNVFPEGKNVLLSDSELRNIVDLWISIGSDNLENLDVDWENVVL